MLQQSPNAASVDSGLTWFNFEIVGRYHLTFHSSNFCMLLPELYALPHPDFFKFHVPTSGLARALRVSTPTLWNSLPHSICFCESLRVFWKHLKTFIVKRRKTKKSLCDAD